MTPGLRLNTAAAHTWAAVVSGTAWKRHTLEDGATLTAEYMRGPVIVWGMTGLEGYFKFVSDAVAKAPQSLPLTLEDQVERLNTAPVFERFRRAARGKVRRSIRWKTGRRPRRLRNLEALADLRYSAQAADKQAAGLHGLSPYIPAKTAKARREARRYIRVQGLDKTLQAIAPAGPGNEAEQARAVALVLKQINRLVYVAGRISRPLPPAVKPATIEELSRQIMERWSDVMAMAVARKEKNAISWLVSALRARRPTLGEILAAFQRAEYRAHLARRVKPAPRRHRIRRPLYARPRPPAAPLAPPVS